MAIIKDVKNVCRNRCASWAASLASISLFVLTILGVYWGLLYYYIHPIDKMLSPVYVSTAPDGSRSPYVHAGEVVFFNWHLYIYRSCPVEFVRFLLNTRTRFVTPLETHEGLAPSIGEVQFKTMIKIPSDLLPDLYELHVKGIFECNPLQAKWKAYPPITFRVLRARDR